MDYEIKSPFNFTLRYLMDQNNYIPIEKLYPMILSELKYLTQYYDEFRPVMVQSHFIKLIEAYFVPKSKKLCTSEINPGQIGFVNKMACQYHIGQVIEELKMKFSNSMDPYHPKSVNIYNSVDRYRLFEILRNWTRQSQHFDPNELDFLEQISNSLYIYDLIVKEKVQFKYGVHQGSLLAPFLYDIYFNEIIEAPITYTQGRSILSDEGYLRKVQKKKIPFYLKGRIMAYADALAIVCNHKIINELTIKFVELAQEQNFKFNLGKTKMQTRARNFRSCFGEIKTEQKFKYLGVFINDRGDLTHHIKHVKQVVSIIAHQLRSLNKLLPLRHMTHLWNTYIRPHFQYVSPLLYTQSKSSQII